MIRLRPSNPRPLLRWLPLAFVTTLVCGLVYVSLQQYVRAQANMNAIQLAEDVATQLYKNQQPAAAVAGQVDIARSIAPFVVLYDSNGRAVDGNGKLNDQLPQLPQGVFDYTAKHTEDRVTWQPQPGVRIAAVVRYYQNQQHAGYVLAGQNLRETDKQQSQLTLFVSLAWATALLGSLAIALYVDKHI